ncbi:MAG: hypothetical protein KTR25_06175 [Myxococcales bacterium]|nr:hypothetical protein [Myxococcales bacterium]
MMSQPEESIRLLRRCLGSVGGPVSAWRFLASLELERAEVEQARRTLLRAVSSYPNEAFLWIALGRVEVRLRNGLLAVRAYERASRLRPGDNALEMERARILAKFGSDGAKREIRVAPLMAEARERLEVGDAAGALQTLATAQALVKKDRIHSARIELERATIYVVNGQPSPARAAVKRGLGLLGKGRYPVRLRADLHVVAAELALGAAAAGAAAAAAARALDLVPAHPFAAVNHGLAVLQMGDQSTAINDLSLALRSGLTNHLAKNEFENLPGVAQLLASDASFRKKVESAWLNSN